MRPKAEEDDYLTPEFRDEPEMISPNRLRLETFGEIETALPKLN